MWQGWHKDAFGPAKRAAGVPKARPYDLRHSFVSLLIQEGVSIIEIARQAGHNPTMTLEVYGHVFNEFDPAERVSAETQIRLARDELVPVSYLDAEAAG
jgi:integrase